MRAFTGLILLLLAPQVLLADRDARRPDERRSQNQPAIAILYADPGFRGNSYTVYPGDEAANFRDVRFQGGGKIDDRVSSIRILGGMRLSIYADPKFRGDRLLVEADVPDLSQLSRPTPGSGSWDDTITAVRADPPPRPREPDRPHGPRAPRGPACIILYAHPNYQGDALELAPGTEIKDLHKLRFPDGSKIDDRVSSIRVLGGLYVTVYADPKFCGDQLLLTGDAPDLHQLMRATPGNGDWGDTITAVRVGELRPGADHRRERDR